VVLVDESNQAHESERGGSSCRPAAGADADGVAALFVKCVGGAVEEHQQGFEREMASERAGNLLLVAEAEGSVIGCARAPSRTA
jgi:hypothetical protein